MISLELWLFPWSEQPRVTCTHWIMNADDTIWQCCESQAQSLANCRMILKHHRTLSAARCFVFRSCLVRSLSRNWLPWFFSVFPRKRLNTVLKQATTASYQIHSSLPYVVIISSQSTRSKLRNYYRVFISPRHQLLHDWIIYWYPGSRNRRINIMNTKICH